MSCCICFEKADHYKCKVCEECKLCLECWNKINNENNTPCPICRSNLNYNDFILEMDILFDDLEYLERQEIPVLLKLVDWIEDDLI